jgi:putative nucleotidyltransferase with HDIG domain
MSNAIEKPISGYGLPRGELFKHSLVVARTANQISRQTHRGIPDEAYTAGLLHDIGKLVLDCHVEPRIGAITDLAQRDSISFAEAERRLLGMDHGEVGAILSERWELPDFLADAIRGHHRTPSSNQSDETASLVAVCVLANRLARSHGTGVGSNETEDSELPSIVLEILGISDEDVVELDKGMEKQIEDED